MRIVLATRHADRAFIPLALMYLKASIVSRGCAAAEDIAMLEFQHDATAEAMADALVTGHPDVIGLSCYVWNITAMMAAARLVRQRAPDIRIVLGGPEVGPVPDAILRAHPYVDVVV